MDRDEIFTLCRAVFKTTPQAIEWPGGTGRKTVVVTIDGQQYVVSKRRSPARAALEAEVLRRLGPSGMVPALVYHKARFLVQTHIQGTRLSQSLENADVGLRAELLTGAAKSLLDLQARATKTGLHRVAPQIGTRAGWEQTFVDMPLRLTGQLGLVCPEIETADLLETLAVATPSFVKWDARPGNAMVNTGGEIVWFDWEHCGCRSNIDDIVWLLADEWSPADASAEDYAINRVAQMTGQHRDAVAYGFKTRAVLHSFVRLSLIFDRKGDGPWWNRQGALAKDRIGVTLAHVDLLCRRAARWADDVAPLRPLVPVLDDINSYAKHL